MSVYQVWMCEVLLDQLGSRLVGHLSQKELTRVPTLLKDCHVEQRSQEHHHLALWLKHIHNPRVCQVGSRYNLLNTLASAVSRRADRNWLLERALRVLRSTLATRWATTFHCFINRLQTMDVAEAKSDNVDDVNVDVDHPAEGRDTVLRYPATSHNNQPEVRRWRSSETRQIWRNPERSKQDHGSWTDGLA